MPRYFSCPDDQTITDQFINFGYLRCGTSSQFEEVTNDFDMFSLLSSLSEFDVEQTGMFISAYLVAFITGAVAGLIVRQFKKT